MNDKKIIRTNYLNELSNYKDKDLIKVLTGIKRSGKSIILEQYSDLLKKEGVNEKNIIYINFEDNNYKELLDSDKLHNYILDNTDSKVKNYIFLDEIQNVPLFQNCIDSLYLRKYLDDRGYKYSVVHVGCVVGAYSGEKCIGVFSSLFFMDYIYSYISLNI